MKVAGFGWSNGSDYKPPDKWTAPEALDYNTFSIKSDVWGEEGKWEVES